MAKFKKGQSGNPTGRPVGAKNKVNEALRESITNFLSGEFEELKQRVKRLTPKDRMKFFVDILPFALPRLQNTSLEMDFEKMSDDQLDRAIEELKEIALKQQNYVIRESGSKS